MESFMEKLVITKFVSFDVENAWTKLYPNQKMKIKRKEQKMRIRREILKKRTYCQTVVQNHC